MMFGKEEKKRKKEQKLPEEKLFLCSVVSQAPLIPQFRSLPLNQKSAPRQQSENQTQLQEISPEDDGSRRLRMVIEHFTAKIILPHLASPAQRRVLSELSDIPKPPSILKASIDVSSSAILQTLKKLIKRGFAERSPEGYFCTRIGRVVRTAYSKFHEDQLKPFRLESGSEKRYDLLVRIFLSQSLGADGVRLTSLRRQLSYSTGYLSDMLHSLVDARLLESHEDWGRPYSLSEIGLSFIGTVRELTNAIFEAIYEGITANPPEEYQLAPEGLIRLAKGAGSHHRIHFDGKGVRFTRL